jgi:hypothetical protein
MKNDFDEFVRKTVSKSIKLEREKAGPVNCVVSRTRTTEGLAEIELVIDNRVVLRFSNETYGDSYEIVARRVADLILEVASNPCSLNGLRG